jgi:DNA repair exonuclease SbcCD nuclease subunit
VSFKFLHAADIHLDSPLRGLALTADDRAEPFRSASRRAFVNLVETAVQQEVAFLAIAGDLFDGDWKDLKTGLFFAEQMGHLARAEIPVFVVYGNHDAETVISRKLPWPDNLRVFSSRLAQTAEIGELKIAVHGRSFSRPDISENIALGYPAPKAGWFNVGLLHTACDGREGHEPYAPCTLDQLIAHNYDYWALGHVHKREVLNEHPHVVFPGNLQGRHVKEKGAKGATLVSVSDGQVVELEALTLDAARWAHIIMDLTGLSDREEMLSALEQRLREEVGAAGDRPLATRVEFVGSTEIHAALVGDQVGLRGDTEAIAFGVSDTIWVEKVKVSTSDPSEGSLALRSDTLGKLVHVIGEVAKDPEIQAKLAGEIRTLSTRLPKSGTETLDFPTEESFRDVLDAGRELILGKLRTSGERI